MYFVMYKVVYEVVQGYFIDKQFVFVINNAN